MQVQQKTPFPNKKYRDSISFNLVLQNEQNGPFSQLKNTTNNKIQSIKKFTSSQLKIRHGNLKTMNSIKSIKKSSHEIDHIRENSNVQEIILDHEHGQNEPILNKQKSKQVVRFRDRVSIENRDSLLLMKGQQNRAKENNGNGKKILNDITNQQKIQMLKTIIKDKTYNLPMTSRRRAPENIKIVSKLLNSPIQSKSTILNQIKCFMCHYPDQNSIFFGKRVISSVKQQLLQIDRKHNEQQQIFFRYDAFGQFLKSLSDVNYDSHQVITCYQTLLKKYTYPLTVKLMLYYLGNTLYQLNNMYEKAYQTLQNMLSQILKGKLFEYIGVYLMLMVKLKGNICEWEECTNYLTKLLAYSWLYRFDNLEIWVYFELSRSYFFKNQQEASIYYKARSEMSICQPKTNVYREMVALQYKREVEYMRLEHKNFNFEKKISISQLMKIESNHQFENLNKKHKENFKIQSQIKHINQYCKIKHVKNLLSRINLDSGVQNQTSRSNYQRENNFSNNGNCYSSRSNIKSCRNLAGNPLLRTHESGLKNLNVYFRTNNIKQQKTLISKNREPRLYTFQNSSKNILVLKQLCRNILLQMKWIIPINVNLVDAEKVHSNANNHA